ncbi:serine-rich adhesin for platelets isoform X3 [Parasteatoda tepidariorum]|uniref:serine-rich adhesin for platelets isoform X3 n=1 Tax=Parasteatoda tepidariorum TaxID=114398 RepID=UPI0039BC3AB1
MTLSQGKCELQFLPSERGKQILIFENYRYNLKRMSKKGKAKWICGTKVKSKCSAIVWLIDGVFHSRSGRHNHETDEKFIERKKLMMSMKKAAVRDVTVPLKTIYEKEIAKAAVSFEATANLPQFQNIRKCLIKSRNSAVPKLPTGDDVKLLLNPQRKTENGKKFLLADSSEEKTKLPNPNVSEEASSSKRMKLSDSATTLETTSPIPEVSSNPDSSVTSESDFDSNAVIKEEIFDSDEDAEVTEPVSNEPNNSLLNSGIILKEESFEVEEPSESLEVESFRNSISDFETSVTPPITEASSVIANHKLADVTEKQDSLVETTVKVSLFSQILNTDSSATIEVKEEPDSFMESTSSEDSLLVAKGRTYESVTVKEKPSLPKPMTETSLFSSMLVEKSLSDFANIVASVTSSSSANGTTLPSSSIMLGNPLTESSNMIPTSLPGCLKDSLHENEARHVIFSKSVTVKEEPSSPEPESISLEDSLLVAKGKSDEFSKSVTVKEEPSSPEPISDTSLLSSMPVENTLSKFENTHVATITSTNANVTALPSSSIMLGNPLAGSSNMIATSLPGSLEDSLLLAKRRNDEFLKSVTVKEEPSSPEPMSDTSLFSSMPVENTLSKFENAHVTSVTSTNANGTALPSANTPMAPITSSSNMLGNSLAESSNMIGTSLSGSAPIEGSPLPGSATVFSVPDKSTVIKTSTPGTVNFRGAPVHENYLYGYTIVSNSLPPEAISQGNDTMMGYSLPGSANLITTSLSGYPNTVGNSLSNLIAMVNNFSPDSSPTMRSPLPTSAIMKASPFPGSLPGSATSVENSLPSSANVIGNYLPSANNVLPPQISYPFGYPCPTIIGASLPGSSNTVQTSLPTSSNVIQTSLSGSSNMIRTSAPGSLNIIQTSLPGSSNVIPTSLSDSSNMIRTSVPSSLNIIQTSLPGSSNVVQTSLPGSSNMIRTSAPGSKATTNNPSPDPANIVRTLLNSANILRSSLSPSTKKVNTSPSSPATVISNSAGNITSLNSSSSSCSTTTTATSVIEPKSSLQGSEIVFKEESIEISETPVELDLFTLERINKQRELIKADFEKQIKLKTINYFMKF